MFVFLSNNLGTILTGISLLVIVTSIILNICWEKKKNKSAGTSACSGCPCGCARRMPVQVQNL
ncbi:hypothetical protein [Treponema sp. R6D11]